MATTFFVPRNSPAQLQEIAIVEDLAPKQVLTPAAGEWLARSPDFAGMKCA
jgi:hypothetical protein